jgi:hypothetical protein
MQHIIENSEPGVPTLALANLVNLYSQRIADRKQRLCDDLSFYRTKLAELDALDPQDCTGLHRIYLNHLERTSALLSSVAA